MISFSRIGRWFQDPPPEFIFEISGEEIAIARTRAPHAHREVPLEAGVITPMPGKDSVANPAAFAAAVARLVAEPGKRRTAALLLPDNSVRLAVLEFDKFPDQDEERLALIKFRLRRTVPFDVDEAMVGYFVQSANSVLAAAAPLETVARFEAPFQAAGLHPGLVMPSSIAMLELLRAVGLVLAVRRSAGVLSVFALQDGMVLLTRSLEIASDSADPLEDIVGDLYPTIVYLEDQTGKRPSKLLAAGFDGQSAARLSTALEVPVEIIDARHPGITGYLASLGVDEKVAA